jgi:hypothetical protein
VSRAAEYVSSGGCRFAKPFMQWLAEICRRSSARRDCISGGWHQYRLGWPTVLPQTAAMRSALATRSLDPRFQPRVRLRSGHGLINLVSESALMFLKIAARPLLALRSINGGFRLSFRCSIQLDRCLIDHPDATVCARGPHFCESCLYGEPTVKGVRTVK